MLGSSLVFALLPTPMLHASLHAVFAVQKFAPNLSLISFTSVELHQVPFCICCDRRPTAGPHSMAWRVPRGLPCAEPALRPGWTLLSVVKPEELARILSWISTAS